MHPVRDLTSAELTFLRSLLHRLGRDDLVHQLLGCRARPMDDGSSYASLELGTDATLRRSRMERGPAREVGMYIFMDADDTPVNVAVNVDSAGALYELDVWKYMPGVLHAFPDDLDSAEWPQGYPIA